MVLMKDFIEHISTKPWSDYSESDYTLQQWHDACLIHIHDGSNYTKADCKLPIKTPDGVINQNGVYAATAALAGARASLQAPPEKKVKAAKALIRIYKSMNKTPPDSLIGMMSHSVINNLIEHFGVSYQNGVQDSIESSTQTWSDIADSCICSINRFNNDPMYAGQDLNKNTQLQKQYDAIVTKAFNDRLVSMSVMPMNKIDDGAFLYSFDRKAQRLIPVPVQVAHQNEPYDFPIFSVNLDDNGFIVGIKAIKPKNATGAMWQSSFDLNDFIVEFIEHHGVKGQHWGIRNRRSQPKFGASKDAKRVLNAKNKAKRSSVNALTTKELKDVTQRMELERKYHQGLPPNAVKKGKSHVKAVLGTLGITTAATLVTFPNTSTGKHVINLLLPKSSGKHFPKPPGKHFIKR